MKIITTYVILLLVCLIISGCSSQQRRLQYVKGLPPIINEDTITRSTDEQEKVFVKIRERAGLKTTPNDGSEDWGKFVEAGFGYIDEQCEQYLDALFWYNRFRNTTNQQLALTGAVTASILGIADASAKTIAITAAAFGFGTATFDNLSGTVLYDLDPSAVKTLVDRARFQYRAAVYTRIASKKSDESDKTPATTATPPLATNRPAAMSLIRGYLSLCLPASIETQVNNAVAATDFEEDPSAKDSLVPKLQRVDRGQIQAMELVKAETEVKILKAKEELKKTENPQTGIKNALTPIEKNLSLSEGKRIQEALCVIGDGDFGKAGSKTREAIKLYQAAKDDSEAKQDGKLNKPGYRDSLIAAGACIGSDSNYLNAFERFLYEDKDAIEKLQERINKELTTLGLSPLLPEPFSGSFDRKTRDAIKQLKEEKGITTRPEELTPDLDEDIDA